jgi:hypothetical protein
MRLFKSLGAALLGLDTAIYRKNLQDEARCREWIERIAAEAVAKP